MDDDHLDEQAERWQIGQFAELVGLSIPQLRRYDRLRLLEPDGREAQSGYRYYTRGQIFGTTTATTPAPAAPTGFTATPATDQIQLTWTDNTRWETAYRLERSTNGTTWFYPIYQNYGGKLALNKFFQLLSQNFHKFDGVYARDLNWGEFVHFWSGAAGVNLKPLATTAFGGWPADWQAQFVQAQADYPAVTYTP